MERFSRASREYWQAQRLLARPNAWPGAFVQQCVHCQVHQLCVLLIGKEEWGMTISNWLSSQGQTAQNFACWARGYGKLLATGFHFKGKPLRKTPFAVASCQRVSPAPRPPGGPTMCRHHLIHTIWRGMGQTVCQQLADIPMDNGRVSEETAMRQFQ